MKHLLIILSLLLLSSPVNGDNHKGETLYRWGEYPDYKWMGFGDKETQPKYQGQVKDGKPNGLGILIPSNGDKYVGSWKNGKKSRGTMTYFYGRKYVGEWLNGKLWNVTFYKPNGTIDGKYVNGKSVEKYEDKYVGNWKDGRPWNGNIYDKDGNIILEIVNGK